MARDDADPEEVLGPAGGENRAVVSSVQQLTNKSLQTAFLRDVEAQTHHPIAIDQQAGGIARHLVQILRALIVYDREAIPCSLTNGATLYRASSSSTEIATISKPRSRTLAD